jgi:hypothetical protein
MASRLLAVALLALALPVARSTAQCTDFSPGWGYPGNGLGATVRDLLSFDDGSGSQLYAAGHFPGSAPSLVRRWNGSNWRSIGSAYVVNDEVRALEVYDHGSGPELYAAGKLTTLGHGPLTNIARRVGSSWQALGSGVNGVVEALASFDDGSGTKLYVIGSFTTAGGVPAPNVARWNGSNWESIGALAGTPHALAVHDDGSGARLYVAGNLNAGPLQRWTGSAWSVVPGVAWNVATRWALASHDDGSGVGSCLYLGGDFSAPSQHLARWNGSQWLSLPGTLTGPVTALGVFREAGVERLFVAGPTSFNGSDFGRIARWNGASWGPLGNGAGHSSGAVLTLQSHDDGNGERLFLGGSFLDMGGLPAHSIARFGDPCGLPVVTSQPQSVQLQPEHGTASKLVQFTVAATGTQPLSFQWLKDGIPLSSTLDINGVASPSLELARWTASTAGSYTCAVSNGVGTTLSQAATLSIPQGPAEEPWEYTPLLVPPRALDSTPGATVVAFESAEFASDGSAIVLGEIEQGGNVRLGRFSLVNGLTRWVATDGMQAPQCELGATFFGTIASSVAPAAGGQVAFLAPLVGSTLPNGDKGIFHFDGSQLVLVARSGVTLPGLGAGETVRQLSFPGAADNGLVAFRANIYSGNAWIGSGLWSWSASAGAQLELRTGQPAPGMAALVQSFPSQVQQVVTPDGRILIDVLLDTNTGWKRSIVPPQDALVLLGHPGFLSKVVQSGDVAPGFPSSCNIELPHALLPTPDGLVITSWIAGPGQFESRAMYRWQPGNLSLLVKSGDPVPGAPAAISMGAMTPLAVNASGDVAFETTYLGNCAGCGTRAICVRRSGTLQRVFDNGLALPPFTPAGMKPLSWTRAALDERGTSPSVSPPPRTARKAFWGMSTLPIWRMRRLPSFCFSSSLRLRLTSPP